MNTTSAYKKKYRRLAPFIVLVLSVLLNVAHWQNADSAESYQINGYYLGATPEEVNVRVDIDPLLEEKYYEVETKNEARLFFVRVRDNLRLYRIVKEEGTKPNNVKLILDSLKAKYGTPDKQQIKTSSVRPKRQMNYVTTVKNRAIWNISETQEFIAEIESKRVVYELIDHDPENVKASPKPGSSSDEGFTIEGWDPDY